MTHATDIVAYTYNAETLCPTCTLQAIGGNELIGSLDGVDIERVLSFCASTLGYDRNNEATYDSGDFPKVVFASQINQDWDDDTWTMADDERCDHCGQPLI